MPAGGICGNFVEIIAAQTAESAIPVSHTLEIKSADRPRRELRDRSGRNQGDGHALAAGSHAGDARDPG
jgi:hypothetical protein